MRLPVSLLLPRDQNKLHRNLAACVSWSGQHTRHNTDRSTYQAIYGECLHVFLLPTAYLASDTGVHPPTDGVAHDLARDIHLPVRISRKCTRTRPIGCRLESNHHGALCGLCRSGAHASTPHIRVGVGLVLGFSQTDSSLFPPDRRSADYREAA